MTKQTILSRLGPRGALVGLLALAWASSACSSHGCAGCYIQPIQGGFPKAERFKNGMQLRITKGGLDQIAGNLQKLFLLLDPGSLTSDISSSGCGSSSNFCCSGKCTAKLSITKAAITAAAPATVKVAATVGVTTSKMRWSQKLKMGCCGKWCPPFSCMSYTVKCDATYNGSLSFSAGVDLQTLAKNDHKLTLAPGASSLGGFSTKDLKFTGADSIGKMYCTAGSVMKNMPFINGLLKKAIEKSLKKSVAEMLDATLKDIATGYEGRLGTGQYLTETGPRKPRDVELFHWTGGHARAAGGGVSLGIMEGMRAAGASPCVPDCEAVGAACTAPKVKDVTFSTALSGNTTPGAAAYHVAIGVHRSAVDRALYAAYRAGGFCVDMDTRMDSGMTSAKLAPLLPSLARLTGGRERALLVSLRPKAPPSTVFRKGASVEPEVALVFKDLALDFFVEVDRRLLRVLSTRGVYELPIRLEVNAKGELSPAARRAPTPASSWTNTPWSPRAWPRSSPWS